MKLRYPEKTFIVYYEDNSGTVNFIDYTENLKVLEDIIVYNLKASTENPLETVLGKQITLGIDETYFKVIKNPIEARTIKALYFGENNGLP